MLRMVPSPAPFHRAGAEKQHRSRDTSCPSSAYDHAPINSLPAIKEGSGAPRGASNQCRAAPAHVAMSRHLGRGARTFGARSPSGAPHAALAGALTSRLSSRPCFLNSAHSGRYPLACKPSAGTAPPAAVLVPQGVMPEAARERFARPRAGAAPCSANRIASGMRPSNEQGKKMRNIIGDKCQAIVALLLTEFLPRATLT